MHYRLFHKNFFRYFHNKTRLPELDFTKPISDRLKKTSSKDQSYSNDQSILKISLRGQCLFGLYPIELALKAKRRQFYQLFFSNTSNDHRQMIENIQNLAKQLSIPIEYTNINILDRLAFDRPHQGVCLDCSSLPIEDIQQIEIKTNLNKISLDLCLVKIHDPMNLGGIIRTAHFFGIDQIILTRGTCQPSPVASKASSGALELMSIYSCNDLKSYLKFLYEQKNIAIICATHQGNISLKTLSLDDIKKNFSNTNLQRIILLIGNEHEGISEDIIQMCHYNVCIQPNSESQISSLNASVACALFLYHISAQMNK
jgi:tRNA G18 (ribose-2'-O)-methylase SpoU